MDLILDQKSIVILHLSPVQKHETAQPFDIHNNASDTCIKNFNISTFHSWKVRAKDFHLRKWAAYLLLLCWIIYYI